MEPKLGGLIQSHLAEITEAALVWLRYERTSGQAQSDPLLAGIMPTIEPPDFPEPLGILRRMRRHGLPMVAGGLIDQPDFFLMEIEAVMEAEAIISDEMLREAAEKAAAEEAKQKNENRGYRAVRG